MVVSELVRPDLMVASNSKLLMTALVSFSNSNCWSALEESSVTSRAPVPLRLVRTTGVGSQLLHDMSLEAEAANGRAARKPQAIISLLVTENTRPLGNINAISTTTKTKSTAKWWKVNETWYQSSFGSVRGKSQQYYSIGTAQWGNPEKKPRKGGCQNRTSPLVTLWKFITEPAKLRHFAEALQLGIVPGLLQGISAPQSLRQTRQGFFASPRQSVDGCLFIHQRVVARVNRAGPRNEPQSAPGIALLRITQRQVAQGVGIFGIDLNTFVGQREGFIV